MTGPSGLAVEVASGFLLTKLGNPGGTTAGGARCRGESAAPFGFRVQKIAPVLGKPEVSKQGSRKALVRKAGNRTTAQREAACPSVTCGLGLAFQLSIRSDPLFHRFRGKTKDLARPVRQKNSKEKEVSLISSCSFQVRSTVWFGQRKSRFLTRLPLYIDRYRIHGVIT